jgi:hypothetical protein
MKLLSSPFSDSPFGESAILSYLEHELPGYRFEAHVDMPFVHELICDFPEIDILEEIKNLRWYHDNAPLAGAGPQRLTIRRWIARAASRSRCRRPH